MNESLKNNLDYLGLTTIKKVFDNYAADAAKQDDAHYAARKKTQGNAKKPPEGSSNSSIDMDVYEKIMNPFGT